MLYRSLPTNLSTIDHFPSSAGSIVGAAFDLPGSHDVQNFGAYVQNTIETATSAMDILGGGLDNVVALEFANQMTTWAVMRATDEEP